MCLRGNARITSLRGFRRIENRGNFPTPIAGTDYVEIVKGPPPPVYGGGKVGGILNFIPKTAKSKTAKFIDKPVGIITTTVGSYGKKLASIEYGTPFTLFGQKSVGAYAFLEHEDSTSSYYHDIYNKDTLFQLAVDTELSDSVLLEYGGMAQWVIPQPEPRLRNPITQAMDRRRRHLPRRVHPACVNLDANHDGFLEPRLRSAPTFSNSSPSPIPFPYAALT